MITIYHESLNNVCITNDEITYRRELCDNIFLFTDIVGVIEVPLIDFEESYVEDYNLRYNLKVYHSSGTCHTLTYYGSDDMLKDFYKITNALKEDSDKPVEVMCNGILSGELDDGSYSFNSQQVRGVCEKLKISDICDLLEKALAIIEETNKSKK